MKRIELYKDGIGEVSLVEYMGDDLTVVNSARVSFGKHKESLDNKDKKLISYLIEHRHTSTLEHCAMTFRFKVPLFVARQHMRHRTWSYNEISRRYTDFNIEFYEPKQFRTQHKSNRQASNKEELINPMAHYSHENMAFNATAACLVGNHHKRSLALFNALVEHGVCREQARGVLPQNMYTEYYGTVNLNNLLKFIDLRSHEGAQYEIQQVANACLELARDSYPLTIEAYKEKQHPCPL